MRIRDICNESKLLDKPTATVGELAEKYHTSIIAVESELKKGIKIDIAGLQKDLGIPVVAVDARKNKGLTELKNGLN